MKTPEGKVKDDIKALCKKYGAYYAMPMGTGYGRAGVPDFLICHQGQFLAVEAKAGKGKTTPHQRKQLAEIDAAGGRAMVVNEKNLGELEAYFRSNT